MSIQRFDLVSHTENYEDAEMVGFPDGDYVLYTDHAAEVERLTAERDDMEARLGIIERNTKDATARSLAQNTLAKRTVQAAPSERERRLEFALRRCQQLADDGVDDPAGPHNVLTHIFNTVEDALAAAPDKPQGE